MVKSMGFGIRQAKYFCLGCVTLGKLLCFSEFQFFICQVGIIIVIYMCVDIYIFTHLRSI